MQKTNKEWFESFPEPQRTQSIENATNKTEMLFSSADAALISSFSWHKSPQGEKYWRRFYRSIGGKFA